MLLSCDSNDNIADVNEPSSFLFEDGFETQNNQFNELFPTNGNRWTTIQQDNPTNATNEIELSTTQFSEGQNSLRLLANPSDNSLSKMNIEKGGFSAFKDDTITISADFYVAGTASLENVLLIDLECCSCWDPDVLATFGVENQCPGIRLMMAGGNDFLSIERGKISGTTIEQTSVTFPRDQWVNVKWEMTLSDETNGSNLLYINGNEVINEPGMNMPNAQIFSDAFLNQGIDFTLQEPTFYERMQIGVTANPTAGAIELFVDNVSVNVQ